MPRHLISDVHEWINETPTVPTFFQVNSQSRERAWVFSGERRPCWAWL